MVRPADRRQAVEHLGELMQMSERRACKVMMLHRSTRQYRPQPDRNGPLRNRLMELAAERTRWGHPMLHDKLIQEGWVVNHKRTWRLYREMKLSLRLKRRKKRLSHLRLVLPPTSRPNERWAMDFVFDRLENGGKLKCLTIVDLFTRQSLAIESDVSIGGHRVVHVLDDLKANGNFPETLVCDNGPEFTSRALDRWAYANGIKVHHIDPGKPTQNGHNESFNGKFRNECLDQNHFWNVADAKLKTEVWRKDYNTQRPHSSLGGKTPEAFAKQWQKCYQPTTRYCEVMTGP